MSIFEDEKVKMAFAIHDVEINVEHYADVNDLDWMAEGLYFIYCGDELRYIGTSGGIKVRLQVHNAYTRKIHRLEIIRVEKKGIAMAIELNLIALLNPIDNVAGRTNLQPGWY